MLAIWEKALGAEHPQVGDAVNNLAEYARRDEDWATAEALYRRALSIFRKAQGDEHSGVPVVLNNLASVLSKTGRLDEALELQVQSVTLREAQLGADHPDLAQSLDGLGELKLRSGKVAESLAAYERCVTIRRESRAGAGTTDQMTALKRLAWMASLGSVLAAPAFGQEAAVVAETAEPSKNRL